MDTSIQVRNILSRTRKLGYEAKLYLVEKLIQQLKSSTDKKSQPRRLSELTGLGSEIWKDVDIDKYVQEERQWD
jgi:hypothetical protein